MLDTGAGWVVGRATVWTGLLDHKAQMRERPVGSEEGSDSGCVLMAAEIQRL